MLKIERYRVLNANQWDKFVHSSNNGTIFHLKQFLNYHPEERFIDHSLVIIKREKIKGRISSFKKYLYKSLTLEVTKVNINISIEFLSEPN